jgi:hypothetical protein
MIPNFDWTIVYDRLKSRIEAAGVEVCRQSLGPTTTGVFDGTSVTTNSDCDQETQCHNLAHALGHIVQWGLETPRCQSLYDELHAAKDRKQTDPKRLERALCAFREYEEEASAYAAGLLVETGNEMTLVAFTPFARADIEAIVSYHRDGVAPVWDKFFADWQARVRRGEFEVRDFVPKPIPHFTPHPMAPQEVIRSVNLEDENGTQKVQARRMKHSSAISRNQKRHLPQMHTDNNDPVIPSFHPC